MKIFLFCALAFLTPLLSASTANSSQHEPIQQLECSNLPRENAVQSFPFNDLPFDTRNLVLQYVPLSCPLVCREWEEMTKKNRAVKLKTFLQKVMYLEIVFSSDKVKTEAGYIESHFSTPGEMYWMVSRIIASSYDRVVESAKRRGEIFFASNFLESFISQRIEDFLESNRLISKFPELLSKSKNRKGLLFDLLSGGGNLCKIPLRVRQFIVRQVWYFNAHSNNAYPLSSFLSSFHDKFDVFKDALVEIDPNAMARACIEIALEVNCTMPSVNDRMRLLGLIKQFFSESSFIQTVCLFCAKLSPDSPILEILDVKKEYPLIEDFTFDVLQSSSEHATAVWCMKEMERADAPLNCFNVLMDWIFNNAFLTKHQLLSEQPTLLKGINAEHLLCNFSHDPTSVDIQALVKWANEESCDKRCLSFDSLVILYSLDDADDGYNSNNNNNVNVISKYSEVLLEFQEKLKDLYYFSLIALGIKCARYLNDDKKAALLQLLYPEQAKNVVTYLNGVRKELLFKVFSLLDSVTYTKLVYHVSESDFSMLVEACLESSETCSVRPFCFQGSKLTLKVLLKYIGNDVKKVADLQHLLKYYQAMVFLLTDHDEIVNSLIKCEWFRYLHWDHYFSEIGSDWKALRAAKRIRKYQTMKT